MVNQIINAMIAAIVGVIAFIVVKAVVDAQNQTTWSQLEITLASTILPLVVLILIVVGLFLGLTKVRGV